MLPLPQHVEKRGSVFDVLLAHSSIQCNAPHDTQTTSEKAWRVWRNEGVNGVKGRHASGGRDGRTWADIEGNAWDDRGRTVAVGGFVAAVLIRRARCAIRRRSLNSEVRRTRRPGCLAIM